MKYTKLTFTNLFVAPNILHFKIMSVLVMTLFYIHCLHI